MENNDARREAMAVLATADLAAALDDWPGLGDVERLRGPEVGLVMLRGRAGGGGDAFNLGEATVTRASVRLRSGETGHAMILGRDEAKAHAAAVLDALWQREPDLVERRVLRRARAEQEEADRALKAKTAATKVDFFTMKRGEDEA